MAEPGRVYDSDDDKPVTKPDLKSLEEGKQQAAVHDKAASTDKKAGVSSTALKGAEEKLGGAGAAQDQVGSGFNPNDISRRERIQKFVSLDSGQKKKALVGGGIIGGIIILIVGSISILLPLKIESIVNDLEDRFMSGATEADQSVTENMFSDYIKATLSDFPRQGCSDTRIDKDCVPTFNGRNPVDRLYRTWRQAGLEESLANDYGIEFRWNKSSNTYYIQTPGDANAEHDAIIPNDDIPASDAGGLGGTGGTGALDTDIFADITSDDGFVVASRNDIRQVVNSAIKDKTLLNRVMLHYKFGRLLEEKYGIKRCIFFCSGRDQLADAVEQGKNSAKIIFAKRVIAPRAAALGSAMECLFDDTCEPEKTQTSTDCQTGDCELAGDPESEVDTTIRERLQALFALFGGESDAEMISVYNSINEAGGMTGYMIQNVMDIVFDKTISASTASNVSEVIPVVGWINLAAQLIHLTATAGPKLRKLSYVVNAASAVSTYMLYRSYSDEVKTGQANPTELGQMTDSLGPTTSDDTDGEGGGTATAEQTPLYQSLIDNNQPLTTSTSSLLNDVLPDKAYAASPSSAPSDDYTCKDGYTPETTQDPGIVCNEELLGQGNATFNAVSHTLTTFPGLSQLTDIANVWDGTIGKLFNLLGGLINLIVSPVIKTLDASCDIPTITILGVTVSVNPLQAYCDIKTTATDAAEAMMKYAVNWLIPSPYGSNQSGGRTFDEMAAGADVSGNDFAHTGLGGEAVSNQQVLATYDQQESQDQFAFQHESFFARLFDTSSQFSLVSKVAMAMPTDLASSIQGSLGSFLEDPLGGLAHGIAALFSIGKVNAAAPVSGCPGDTSSTAQYDDFFCVTQYGYPAGTIPTDPETYWKQNCNDNTNVNAGQMTVNWNNAVQNVTNESIPNNNYTPVNSGSATAFLDPNTGEGVNTTTDPCLLIQSAVGSAGALFNSSLLTPDDLADSSPSTTASSGTNVVAQTLLPTTKQSTNFFAIVFHDLGSLGKTLDQQFKNLNVIWTSGSYHEL